MRVSAPAEGSNREVAFLDCADRLSELIMGDHRPAGSGCASAAELVAGNARREIRRGADRAEVIGIRTRPPGAREHARSRASRTGCRWRFAYRARPRVRCHAAHETPAPPVRKGSRVRD